MQQENQGGWHLSETGEGRDFYMELEDGTTASGTVMSNVKKYTGAIFKEIIKVLGEKAPARWCFADLQV